MESTQAHVAETSSRSLADTSHFAVLQAQTAKPDSAGSAEDKHYIEQCNGTTMLDNEGICLQPSDQNRHDGNEEASSTSQSSASSVLRIEAPALAARSGAAPQPESGPEPDGSAQCEGPVRLERIWVYPIKSCAGFTPSSWPLGANGLLYDRCARSTVRCLPVRPCAGVMPCLQPL